MISHDLIQKAIINKLKGDATLITLIGSSNNVKESQWQGTTFNYPAIRIGEIQQTPLGAGTGDAILKGSSLTFRVESYSEEASSRQVSKINNQVVSILFDAFIYGYDDSSANTFNILRIACLNMGSNLRLEENLWYANSYFISELHKTS